MSWILLWHLRKLPLKKFCRGKIWFLIGGYADFDQHVLLLGTRFFSLEV